MVARRQSDWETIKLGEEGTMDPTEKVKHCTSKRSRCEQFLPTQRLTVTLGDVPGVTLRDVRASDVERPDSLMGCQYR